VETDKSETKIRRKGGKALPELTAGHKKRDQKAADKEEDKEDKKGAEEALPALDERGNVILCNNDFESPIIVHFKTTATDEKDFKVNWKDIESGVRK
jgi:hypothetical protein